jgi:hypothetical protein
VIVEKPRRPLVWRGKEEKRKRELNAGPESALAERGRHWKEVEVQGCIEWQRGMEQTLSRTNKRKKGGHAKGTSRKSFGKLKSRKIKRSVDR